MANTSATGGYLAPHDSPEQDADLEDVLRAMVSGISGIPAQRVLHLQPGQAAPPAAESSWCVVAVQEISAPHSPAIEHQSGADGADQSRIQEEMNVLCSFYGPQARGYASILRDGIFIPQNSEAINALRMSFIGASQIHPEPELVNPQWGRRYDLVLQMRRQVVRVYPVLNILSAGMTLAD